MIWLIILGGLLSVAYGAWAIADVNSRDAGTQRMQEIAAAIREGAQAYLKRQYITISMVGAVLFVVIGFLLGWAVAIGFLIGAVLSGAAGFIGMNVSVRANVRTAQAASQSLAGGLDVAFKAGAVTGLLVAGLALLGVAVYYWILTAPMGLSPSSRGVIDALVALGFGASLISIFARLGGGIFTKGADVGADLVGKVEAGIPEDDPRNPATIADNVGDNVGDCAGMAADLFETYAVTVVATMVLAAIFFGGQAILASAMLYPLAICAACILTSIVGTFFVKLGANNSIMGALYKGLWATSLLSIVASASPPGPLSASARWARSAADDHRHGAVHLRRHRPRGHRPHRLDHRVLHGHGQAPGGVDRPGVGHRSRHQRHPGPRGVARVDGAAGHGHRRRHHRHLPARRPLRHGDRCDLDARHRRHDRGARTPLARSRTTPAASPRWPACPRRSATRRTRSTPSATRPRPSPKGYAIGSAGLGALVLFAAYSYDLQYFAAEANKAGSTLYPYFKGMGTVSFDLSNPYVVAGLIFGGLIPYLFGGIAMTAVGRAAGSVVEEVRRQFKEMPGIMQGTQRPDYGRAVDMLTKAAIKEMIIPSLLPVLAPIVAYFGVLAISGSKASAFAALGASLLGVIVNGLFVAISMTSGGGAWDNAKKSFEDGFVDKDGVRHLKGSEAHKASVTGDTVGDPYKDTAGPAVNPAIKITNIVALLLLAVLAHA